SWAQGQIDNALGAAGTSAAQVGEGKLEANSVVYHGLLILGSGAVLAGMIFGAIVVFVIDRVFIKAGIVCLIASGLTFAGIIHAEKVEWNANGGVSLGFLFAAVVCFGFALTRPEPREKDEDELLQDALENGGPHISVVKVPAVEGEPQESAADISEDRGTSTVSPVSG
ncbi:MAG: xanthine/uracil/vitamin permease, partial [Pseudonocardiales bacterium]|nr:xanthine/uracil/vitamin permease [Pseudonocardiales bacterium]